MAALELISFGVGADWIKKLWGKLNQIKEKENEELIKIEDVTFGNPLDIAKYYVEPNCQEINPADHHEQRHLTAREPIMKKIDQFFKAEVFQEGDNQLFILSDAGMGKTALLTMLKLMHLTAFLPLTKDCILKKLGEKTLEEVSLSIEINMLICKVTLKIKGKSARI